MPGSRRWHQDKEVSELIEHLDQPDKYGQLENLNPSEVATILKEYDRCRKDFVYAARNYFWISNKKLGDQLFSLWPSQELILQKIQEIKARGLPQKLIIIKARQLGCSTLIEGLICWRTVFFSNVNALVVSKDINHAAYVLWPIMQFIYDRLPWWIQPMTSMRKAEEGMIFQNPRYEERRHNPGLMSAIHVKGAQSGGVGQGIRLSAVHFSEFCDCDDSVAKEIIDEDMVNALVEDANTFAILESTAKGANRYSHKLWKRCMELGRDAEWFPLFLPWFFEDTRKRVVTAEFKLEKEEVMMRDRIVNEWVRCDNAPCLQYHPRYVRGEDRSETTCVTCNTGLVHSYILTDEQLHWIQHRRRNAQRDDESIKKLKQEMACVVAGTYISCENGIVPIAKASKCRLSDQGKITAWYDHGIKDTVKVTTKKGRELICTPDHRIFLPSGEYKEAQHLVGNEIISLAPPRFADDYYLATWDYTPSCQMGIKINEDWGRLLGYFMGDGCWSQGIKFACDAQDMEVADDIARLCEKLIGHPSRMEVSKSQKMIQVFSQTLDWSRIMWGLGCLRRRGSDNHPIRYVNVPDCIKQSPVSVVKQFLSALIECDGHAYRDSPKTVFFTSYPEFSKEVQLLLLGFGVNAGVREENKTKINPDGTSYTYIGRNVYMQGEASNAFHREIGFISDRKRGTACIRPSRINTLRWNRNKMEDWVVSVEPSDPCEVYDITVEDTHRFGANGILVHNSTGEAAFQISGVQLFGAKAQEFVNSCIREPLAKGDFDAAGKFHGENTKVPKIMGTHGFYHPCFQEECPLDHSFDRNPLFIWEMPEVGADYCIGADVADGLGGKSDYSVGGVIRYTNSLHANRQVATWRSNEVEPMQFASKLYWLGMFYNAALLAVEMNKFDICIGSLRFNLNYPNMYRWKHIDSVNPLSNKFGWETNMKSRPRLWQTMRAWLNHEMFIIRSGNAFGEMINFVKSDEDALYGGADLEEHDDEFMALMIALFCCSEGQYNEQLGLAMPKNEMSMETAPFHVTCMSCQHKWPEMTISDPIVDMESFHPELDVNGRVSNAGGTRCPVCKSRRISVQRNTANRLIRTDADRLIQEREWSPDLDFDQAEFSEYGLL